MVNDQILAEVNKMVEAFIDRNFPEGGDCYELSETGIKVIVNDAVRAAVAMREAQIVAWLVP